MLSTWQIMRRPVCCNFFCRFFFRGHTHSALHLLRTIQLLRFHDICADSATIASNAAFGCRNGLDRDYRAYPDEDLLCCRFGRRRKLRWAATRAHLTTLSTDRHPTVARALGAWRAMHRTACYIFFCFFFRRHIHNALLLLRDTRLLRLCDIFTDIATAASVAAFCCRNGLNRD